MAKFVDAFSKSTGDPHRVPEHFINHPVLGRDLTLDPPRGKESEGTPSEDWTVPQLKKYAEAHSIDLGGATAKDPIFAAITAHTGTPA